MSRHRLAMGQALNRALGFTHRQIDRANRLLPEIALVLFDDPRIERAGLIANYGAGTAYASRANQDLGLYPFEARALSAFFPPPPAKLLLPGAGAGRELFALRNAGYAVDAFDASPALVAAACARGGSGAARLDDLATWSREMMRAATPPLYGGVLCGWGMWTHLVRRRDRLDALAAFRRVCPRGPVLISFWRREKIFDVEEEVIEPDSNARWLRVLRSLRAIVHEAPVPEPGTKWRGGMFVHVVSEAELIEEAASASYGVAHYERDGSRFPNAVLVPDAPRDASHWEVT